MEVQRERKRRKWDVAATDPDAPFAGAPPRFGAPAGVPLPADAIKRAQDAAKAVVDRLNKESLAKGLVPPARVGIHAEGERKEILKDITINDAPSEIRYNLTRRGTQTTIQRMTNTVIVTKGCFCGPGAPIDDLEKPLYLRVIPGNKAGETDDARLKAVEAATVLIRRLLQGENSSVVLDEKASQPGGLGSGRHANPTSTSNPPPFQSKLVVNIPAVPSFGLVERLKGPDDKYLLHITSETGATVVLRGDGTDALAGNNPLHLLVTCPTRKGLNDAVCLAQNLIDTVRSEFEKMFPQAPVAHPPPGYYAAQPPHSYERVYAPPPPGTPMPPPVQPYPFPHTPGPDYMYYGVQRPYGQGYPPPLHPPQGGCYQAPPGSIPYPASNQAAGQMPPPPPVSIPAPPPSPPGQQQAEQKPTKRKFTEAKMELKRVDAVVATVQGPQVPPPPPLWSTAAGHPDVQHPEVVNLDGGELKVKQEGEGKEADGPPATTGLSGSGDVGIGGAGLVDYEGDD